MRLKKAVFFFASRITQAPPAFTGPLPRLGSFLLRVFAAAYCFLAESIEPPPHEFPSAMLKSLYSQNAVYLP